MLVRNFTSYNDLESKRQLQRQLLEVEAQNETENQRRLSDYKNPYKPVVVPPQYKTNAEMAKDKLEQEKIAINHIEELGFDYSKAGEIVAWLGDIDRLVKFNANFKGIRKELSETTNPRLLNSEFLKNYLDRYFEDLDVNYGHKFSRNDTAGRPVPQSLDEIQLIFPNVELLNGLRDRFTQLLPQPDIAGDFADEIENDVIEPLTIIIGSLPTPDLLQYLKSTLTQQERSVLVRNLASVSKSIHLISQGQVEELLEQLQNVGGIDELEILVKKAKRALGFATANNLGKIWKLLEKYAQELQSRGNVAVGDELQENINLEVEELQDIEEPPNPPATITPAVAKTRSRGLDNPRSMASKKDNLQQFFAEIQGKPNQRVQLTDVIDQIIAKYPEYENNLDVFNLERRGDGTLKSTAGTPRKQEVPNMKEFIAGYYESEIENKKSYNPVERPKFRVEYPDGSKSIRGVGLPKQIEKHLAEDNREMKSLAKAFKKHKKVEKEVDSSSDSDSDSGMKGKGFRHTRIKVGGGVKVRQQPTYAHFGKYIIHIPHLTDKNVFNVKYPSMGSIPSIKPMTISDDYKDFVLDVLDSGKMNERILKKLPDNEIRHFEKVVSGAGLTEVLKLKRGNTNEEKKDLDRYYLLRGEIEAGNNAESVIKELRGLIVKFMNDGRVHKSEGLHLLMELSVM
jgi:ribosomal protein L15